MLKLKNISCQYGTKKVLQHINLHIRPNEFTAIIGPLGTGKSTLLKISGALLKPKTGTVSFQNKKLLYPNPEIAYVFQKQNLFPWLTIRENISLPLKISCLSKKNINNKVCRALQQTGLTQLQNNYPFNLSGGQEQLTSLARAYAQDSKLLLLDEPFAHLDYLATKNIQQILLNLWLENRKTIILVTHDINEACFLAEKIYILKGSPAAIKNVIKIPFVYPRPEKLKSSIKFQQIVSQVEKETFDSS